MIRYGLGIDLGGSSIKAVAIQPSGQLLLQRNIDFAVDEPMTWALRIRALSEEIQAECREPAETIGLSAPGLAAKNGRCITSMPGRLQGLEGLDWTEFLHTREPVPVLNDAHAALLGEAWLGAGVGLRNFILLTLGTGVGGAAMVDGQLLRGQLGRAGHFGHICLDLDGPVGITNLPGTLEFHIGNYSLPERSGGRFKSTHDLIAAHLQNDPEASRIWLRSVRALGCALASLINVLDPEAVLLGGGITRAAEALFQPLQGVLREVEWRPGGHPVKVIPAVLGEFAGAVGAAGHAFALVSGKGASLIEPSRL